MYTDKQKEIVRSYCKWLSNMDWDVFSTFTYRFNIREKQNFNIMTQYSVGEVFKIAEFKLSYVLGDGEYE